MCRVIHLPNAVTHRHGAWAPRSPKQPPDDSAKLLECADALSDVLNSCPALCIPTEEREAFLAGIHQFLVDREARRLARERESAS